MTGPSLQSLRNSVSVESIAVFGKLLQMKIEFVFSSKAFWLQYPPFYLPPCCFICVVLSDMGQLKCGKIFLWILKTRSPLIVNSLKRGLCAAHAQAYTHQLCFKTSFYFFKNLFLHCCCLRSTRIWLTHRKYQTITSWRPFSCWLSLAWMPQNGSKFLCGERSNSPH